MPDPKDGNTTPPPPEGGDERGSSAQPVPTEVETDTPDEEAE